MTTNCIIYEGMFDPPHINHYLLLSSAMEKYDADAIVVVANDKAANQLSRKPNATPWETRLWWAEDAFGGLARYSPVDVITTEAAIFTIDILVDLIALSPGYKKYTHWYYLMGPDRDLREYKDHFKIEALVEPIQMRIGDPSIRSALIRENIRTQKPITGMLAPGLDWKEIHEHFKDRAQ